MLSSIRNSNRYIILAIISILAGLTVYFSMSKIGADEQYAALHISIGGVKSVSGYTVDKNILGTFEIIKPDGTKVDLGSSSGIYEDAPLRKLSFMAPGSGYQVNFKPSSELGASYATFYKLDPTVANNTNSRTLELAADQTTVATFTVTLVNGDYRPIARFEGTKPGEGEKIADITVVDRDGKSYSAPWPISGAATTFSVPPGSITATLSNINPKLALKSAAYNENPRTTIVHAYHGQSSDFVFIDAGSATGSSPTSSPTAAPSATASSSPSSTTTKSSVTATPSAKATSAKAQATTSPSASNPDQSPSAAEAAPAPPTIVDAKPASSSIPPVMAGLGTTVVTFLIGFAVLSRFKP